MFALADLSNDTELNTSGTVLNHSRGIGHFGLVSDLSGNDLSFYQLNKILALGLSIYMY